MASSAIDVESLVDELADLAQSHVPADAFWRRLIEQCVRALGAAAGVYYSLDVDGRLSVESAASFMPDLDPKALLQSDGHDRLLRSALQTRESAVFEPSTGEYADADAKSSSGNGTVGTLAPAGRVVNTTPFLLLVCPVISLDELNGVIEVFQRPNTPLDARRGYLRFLETIAEIAAEFQRNTTLQRLRVQSEIWQRFETFCNQVHSSLDQQRTAFLLANESRRLIGCNRVMVSLNNGRKQRVLAVSGEDIVDRRATLIRHGEALAAAVARMKQPLWYDDNSTEFAPQLETLLQSYLDVSHARTLALLPMSAPDTSREDDPAGGQPGKPKDRTSQEIIGVFIAESFTAGEDDERTTAAEPDQPHSRIAQTTQQDSSSDSFRNHCEVAARHGGLALHNALTHEGLPFFRVIKTVGKATSILRLKNLPKTVTALAILAAVIAALVFIPADFNISGPGELQPKQRRDVFARTSGDVDKVLVVHGQDVVLNQPLVKLIRYELDQESARLLGEKQTATARLAGVTSRQLSGFAGLSRQEAQVRKAELASEKEEITAQLQSIEKQLALLAEETGKLIVNSPLAGQVLTWDVRDLLETRPVQPGQVLMTVADVDGPWVVEVRVPDHDIGHLLAVMKANAQASAPAPIPVTFVLATDPETEYVGEVSKIAQQTEIDEEGQSSVRVIVVFDRSQISQLRPGATVIPKIACGRRSIGYVWFHDLWDTIRTQVLF